MRITRRPRPPDRSQSLRRALPVALAAGAALVGLVPGMPTASAQTPTPSPTPGVYVQELPAFTDSLVGTPTGVPLFIGQATAGRTNPIIVNDLADFDAAVADPSPALAAAVGAFYANGGGTAQVLTTTGEDAATLAAAADAQVGNNAEWQLLVVPALGSLAGADYLTVADALARAATRLSALALLDPPTALPAGAAQDPATATTSLTALADQLRLSGADPDEVVLLSSGLQDATTAAPVSGAAALAAVMDRADTSVGPWAIPAGVEYPLAGLTPVFAPSNALTGELQTAGLMSFRTMVGYGTVVWGTATLGRSTQLGVPYQRMVEFISHTVDNGLQSWIFAANDATTWTQAVAATSQFLNSLWVQGGLVGVTSADAYEVQAGVPSTMSPMDVLNGQLVVSVHVTLAEQTPVYLSFVQDMQS